MSTRIAVGAAVLLSSLSLGTGVAAAGGPVGPCPGCGPSSHVVHQGEWLWSIARTDLAQRGIDAGVASYVRSRARAIYSANRAVIGSDPDLLRPGTRLVLPPL